MNQDPTNLSLVQVTEMSDGGSAKRDNCELPGLGSALHGRNDAREA